MDYAEDTVRCNTNNEDENIDDQERSDPVQNEETTYEQVHVYLSQGRYPLETTKQENASSEREPRTLSYWMAFSTGKGRFSAAGKQYYY